MTESDTAASECLDCSHAMSEHLLIRTGENNVLICHASDCDCVEIRSSASRDSGQQIEPTD
jgi:hypothetical protein